LLIDGNLLFARPQEKRQHEEYIFHIANIRMSFENVYKHCKEGKKKKM
jgi:hypothetical protein